MKIALKELENNMTEWANQIDEAQIALEKAKETKRNLDACMLNLKKK